MKPICLTFCVCMAVFIIPNRSTAQTTNTFSGWVGAFSTISLKNKFSLHLEGNVRSGNQLEHIQNVIIRTGLNYRIGKKETITLGYAWVSIFRTINGVTGWGPEDRIWEQYSIVEPFTVGNHFITLQNRFRLEQRWISKSVVDGDKLETDGYNFIQRIRYFFRFIVPFSKTGPTSFTKGAFFSLQNEVFFNIGNTSVVNGKVFDQNRAYFSLGYRFSPKNDTEIGYLNQFVLNSGTAKTNNNIVQIATYIRL